MEDDLKTVVHELTGRTVTACMAHTNVDGDMVVEVFLLDHPLVDADAPAEPTRSATWDGTDCRGAARAVSQID